MNRFICLLKWMEFWLAVAAGLGTIDKINKSNQFMKFLNSHSDNVILFSVLAVLRCQVNGDIVGQVILPPVILNEYELMTKWHIQLHYGSFICPFANDAKRIGDWAGGWGDGQHRPDRLQWLLLSCLMSCTLIESEKEKWYEMNDYYKLMEKNSLVSSKKKIKNT